MKDFLDKGNVLAVVGASTNPEKYGYRLFVHLLRDGYEVFPINPKKPVIEGVQACGSLKECEKVPDVVIMVIPAEKQENIIKEILELGIKKVWFQPGSESKWIETLKENDVSVVEGICYVKDGLGEELLSFRV